MIYVHELFRVFFIVKGTIFHHDLFALSGTFEITWVFSNWNILNPLRANEIKLRFVFGAVSFMQ